MAKTEIKFWDHSKRLDWFRARALSRKILQRPEILGELRECIEKYWGADPSQVRSLRLWRKVLHLSPEEFQRCILSDNPEAEEIRESYPPYAILTPAERVQYGQEARREVALV